MLAKIPDIIEGERHRYAGHSISEILAEMKRDAVNKIAADFAGKRFSGRESFLHATENNRNGTIPNISSHGDPLTVRSIKSIRGTAFQD